MNKEAKSKYLSRLLEAAVANTKAYPMSIAPEFTAESVEEKIRSGTNVRVTGGKYKGQKGIIESIRKKQCRLKIGDFVTGGISKDVLQIMEEQTP